MTFLGKTRTVQIAVTLPEDIATQAEKEDPEFLSRIILYGLTRRSIYRHLRDSAAKDLREETGADWWVYCSSCGEVSPAADEVQDDVCPRCFVCSCMSERFAQSQAALVSPGAVEWFKRQDSTFEPGPPDPNEEA